MYVVNVLCPDLVDNFVEHLLLLVHPFQLQNFLLLGYQLHLLSSFDFLLQLKESLEMLFRVGDYQRLLLVLVDDLARRVVVCV